MFRDAAHQRVYARPPHEEVLILRILPRESEAGVSKDGHTRYAAFCFTASSRNARRRILPTLVFGSSVRNSIWCGRL